MFAGGGFSSVKHHLRRNFAALVDGLLSDNYAEAYVVDLLEL